ncbi:tyrosine-protein phosphatase [Kitasatospora sp. CM 4170]|uniref:Tyrosine-protein phosphatase n=1 Tax=Kitasatospora aburaviensis TaxID=67265 RepID=A0ABW1EY42_9ACTN|nr:tyrosine-protein phosphatase [Kitasatospora sp. CM 4170]WNM47084.1 tyrosine-protein phosphatase [Kitasatospora sp. CM 4170]
MTDALPDREPDLPSAFIDIPGVRNFRDAGGVGTLRKGVLYRSGSFHALAPEGAQRLKALGLRLVIDLRSPFELEVWPDLRHGLDHEAVNLPTLPANREDTDRPWPEDQAELYPFMAQTGGPSLVAAVRRLGAPGGVPAVVHCAVGKDRTGLTIAVVQSLLGASDADVMADYLLSNAGLGLLDGPTPYIDETGAERISRPISAPLLASSLTWIRTNHGSIADYLRAHGTTDEDLAALRDNLSA